MQPFLDVYLRAADHSLLRRKKLLDIAPIADAAKWPFHGYVG